ncbi:hypothetical protein MTR_4g010720 [Medicago truncatula]|uniref:Uncharacterized protein n=2 Tax=Medicago truncatula TaxID=3880 RepID=G7JI57_MEDTR|nr:hypothetical protein MTR_4g010720 [Medicago truncatula]
MQSQPLASPGLYGNCVTTLPTCLRFECWQMDGDGELLMVVEKVMRNKESKGNKELRACDGEEEEMMFIVRWC